MMIFEGKQKLNYKDLQEQTGVGIPTLKSYVVKKIIASEQINGEAWFDETAVQRIIEWRRLNIKPRGGNHTGKPPQQYLKVKPEEQEDQSQPQEEPEPPDVPEHVMCPVATGATITAVVHTDVHRQFQMVCEALGTTPEQMLREFVVDQVTQHKDLLTRLQEVEAERQRIITEFKRARA